MAKRKKSRRRRRVARRTPSTKVNMSKLVRLVKAAVRKSKVKR